MEREPGKEYILSLSYGKDSIASLEAIRLLGWPLDRIVHAEVWATDAISADLPPMVEFKAKADVIIKERYGIEVEHVCAMRDGEKLTYNDLFYHEPVRKCKSGGGYLGFPIVRGPWCNSRLKIHAMRLALSGRVMVQKAQASLYTDGQQPSGDGANASSRWSGTTTFQTCAVDGALTQIPSSIWALRQMSRKESPGTKNLDMPFRWWLSAGTRRTAVSGVRRMTCFPRFIPLLTGGGAGSATTKALASCGSCAGITRNTGR